MKLEVGDIVQIKVGNLKYVKSKDTEFLERYNNVECVVKEILDENFVKVISNIPNRFQFVCLYEWHYKWLKKGIPKGVNLYAKI